MLKIQNQVKSNEMNPFNFTTKSYKSINGILVVHSAIKVNVEKNMGSTSQQTDREIGREKEY